MAKAKNAKSTDVKTTTTPTSANRIRRINKHLKKHPNDEKAELALTNQGQPRKAPQEKLGFLKSYKPDSLNRVSQITKDLAHKTVQNDKLSRKALFRPVASFKTVFDKKTKESKTEVLMLHTSKLSNFKDKKVA